MFLEEIRCGLQRAIALLARLMCALLLLAALAPQSRARHTLERLLASTAPPPGRALVIPPDLQDVRLSFGGHGLLGTLEDPSCEDDDGSSAFTLGDAPGETRHDPAAFVMFDGEIGPPDLMTMRAHPLFEGAEHLHWIPPTAGGSGFPIVVRPLYRTGYPLGVQLHDGYVLVDPLRGVH